MCLHVAAVVEARDGQIAAVQDLAAVTGRSGSKGHTDALRDARGLRKRTHEGQGAAPPETRIGRRAPLQCPRIEDEDRLGFTRPPAAPVRPASAPFSRKWPSQLLVA